MKYQPKGPREFVPYDYPEYSIENIKEACKRHFKDNRPCDVLVCDKGPSATRMDQLLKTDVFYVRFLNDELSSSSLNPSAVVRKRKAAATNNEDLSFFTSVASVPPAPSMKPKSPKPKLQPVESTFPKSLSALEMMNFGALIKKKSKTETIEVEEFDVSEKSWASIGCVNFQIDEKPLGEGGFRLAYAAKSAEKVFSGKRWVIKMYNERAKEVIKNFKISNEDHARKNVQMHLLARNLCGQYRTKIKAKFPEIEGNLYFHKIYFGKMDGRVCTIEPFLEGKFEKWINNNGAIKQVDPQSDNFDLCSKAEAFVHYTWEESNHNLIVTDIQGVGYYLTDPEIATESFFQDQGEEGNINFCVGNLSEKAIRNFFDTHICNIYCKKLALPPVSRSE
ncbi:myosin heavy chain kinase C-like [Clytia hemisphaerica]